MNTTVSKKRILILGGGFGGVATARHLERNGCSGGARSDSATDGSPLALVGPEARRPKPAVIEGDST